VTAKPRKLRMANITPLKPKATPTAAALAQQLPKPLKPPKTSVKPGTTPGSVPGFKAAPGRPESNIGKYLIKPTDKSRTGYEMLNTEPQIIEQTHERYLKQFELPPALQPKYLRKPEVLERQRTKEISKGWIKPRSQV
jgi:hypothetical protein